MADNGVKIEGLDEVIQKLKSLGPDLQRKALRTGVRKGANLVKKAAVQKAPKDTGSMAKNIAVQFASRTSKEVKGVAFRVGVRGGAQASGAKVKYARSRKGKRASRAAGSSTWYWRLVEFGTEKMKARPFMRPALSRNTDQIISTVAEDIDKGITTEMKRKARADAKGAS